jgi:hypothetical protein
MLKVFVSGILWLVKQIIRFLIVLKRYIRRDLFKLFNLTSISISLTLIGTYLVIMTSETFSISADGKITGSHFNQIELLSDLSSYYGIYNIYSSVNAIIIFWRILQFFSFSYRLSAFTEILSSSKNDIIFFMLMFIIVLFGYAVMGFSFFGEQSALYSSIFFNII